MSSKPSPSKSPTASPQPWSYRLILNVSPCSLGRNLIRNSRPTSSAHSRKTCAWASAGVLWCSCRQTNQPHPATTSATTPPITALKTLDEDRPVISSPPCRRRHSGPRRRRAGRASAPPGDPAGSLIRLPLLPRVGRAREGVFACTNPQVNHPSHVFHVLTPLTGARLTRGNEKPGGGRNENAVPRSRRTFLFAPYSLRCGRPVAVARRAWLP